ncbi:ABC transporter permease [Streptomyces sp. NPDC002018]|uniref:ABC transporter permease n=1 Tax=Streptomyces sp. NPDC002018 TaxID=3364629 RepID=UPI0036B5B34F
MRTDHEGRPRPGGTRGARRTLAGRWAAFRSSPCLPAVVVSVIAAAAAGLFAGSYTYNMANPTPHHIPAAIVGPLHTAPATAFVDGMEKRLNTSLELRPFATDAAARHGVEQQEVFAILTVLPGRVDLAVASAAGASVAQVLTEAAPVVARSVGVPVRISDVKPLQRGDPRGLALFYVSLAAVIVGFVGAAQLNVHASALDPAGRIAFTVGYSLLGGFSIAAVVDWWLDAIRFPFAESWLILSFTMFTTGMVFTMFSTLVGRWALVPTWGLMVLLGNPSSGGAVSWPLLPSLLGHIGRWLPPGASINAQHTAVYFGDAQHVFPFAVLAGWALVSTAVFLFWRERHHGGRASGPARPAPPPGGAGRDQDAGAV